MTPSWMELMPPATRSVLSIPFSVADWTNLNLVPGGGNAATAYTKGMHAGLGASPMQVAYALQRFCIDGLSAVNTGQARVASWYNGPSGAVWTYFPAVVPATPGPKNVGSDITVDFNALLANRQYHQFIIQVKGEGVLYMGLVEAIYRAGL